MFNYYINEKNMKEQKKDEERKEKKIDEAKRKSKQIINKNIHHYI